MKTNHNFQENVSKEDKQENNNKKQELPETGETESKNITLLGGILAAISGIFLLGRGRRKKQ